MKLLFQGAPPKVIWLEVGNAGTDTIVELLRDNEAKIIAFEQDTEASLLILNQRLGAQDLGLDPG